MAIPLLVGAAIAAVAGGAGGGILGSMFGGSIDEEKKNFEKAVSQYMKESNALQQRFENFTSISDVINASSLAQKSNSGLDSTYLTNLANAFKSPQKFKITPDSEDING
jgi:hypothetical protein